jgi:hypothetical protein
MAYEINFVRAATVSPFTHFKDVYNQFCGDISYTLEYVKGVPNKDLNLVTLDSAGAKLTISYDLISTGSPPNEVYDHRYVGIHDVILKVSWVNS